MSNHSDIDILIDKTDYFLKLFYFDQKEIQ